MEKDQVPVPDELVFEILTRLPAKSLFRYKRVCKSWNSRISDPSFVEAHRSRSASDKPTDLLISFPDKNCPDWNRTLFSITRGKARRLFGFSYYWTISQSVNGLICVYERYLPARSPRVRLCNPTTREYVTLPPTIFSDLRFCYQSVFLGFDPSARTYKILRAWNCGCSKYEIFTLGGDAQSWRIIEDGPEDPPATKGICLNGTIYWAEARTVPQNGMPIMENRMIAFDVGEEKFRFVPTPPAASIWETHTSNMIQTGGRIAIIDHSAVLERISNIVILWKLEDSVNGFWSQRRIPLPQRWRQYYPELLPFFVSSDDDRKITLIPRSMFKDWYVVGYNLEEERTMKKVVSGLTHDDDWDSSYPLVHNVSAYFKSPASLKQLCGFQTSDSGFFERVLVSV